MQLSKKYFKQKFLPLLIACLFVVLMNVIDLGRFFKSMKGYYLILVIIGIGIYFSLYYIFALKCPTCKFPSDPKDNFCRNCGENFKEQKPIKKYTVFIEDLNKKINKLTRTDSHDDQLQ